MQSHPSSKGIARRGAGLVLGLALALTAAGTAAAATRTTAPGAVAHIPITLTSSAIVIPKDQFTQARHPEVARYPRGASIDFKVVNRGSAPVKLVLRVTSKLNFYGASKLSKSISTPLIAPGRSAHIKGTFVYRASFEFDLIRGGTIVARHSMVVF